MSTVESILMKRDRLSKEEAHHQKMIAQMAIMEAIENGDYDEAEDIMMDELGLEMDYIDDVLF